MPRLLTLVGLVTLQVMLVISTSVVAQINDGPWAQASLAAPRGLTAEHGGIIWDGTRYITAGELYDYDWFSGIHYSSQDAIHSSIDGRVWVTLQMHQRYGLRALIRARGMLIAVGDQGAIRVSTEGTVWSNVASGTTAGLHAVAQNDTVLVAVGNGGAVSSSTDGLHWSAHSASTTVDLLGVTWTGSKFVATGSETCTIQPCRIVVRESIDGSTWTAHDPNASKSIAGVAGGNGNTVLVADDGTVLVSANGAAWLPGNLPADAKVSGVLWTGARFIAYGSVLAQPPGWTVRVNAAAVFASADGLHWSTIATLFEDSQFNAMAWNGSEFLATAEIWVTYRSTDGVHWSRQSGTPNNYDFLPTAEGASLTVVTWTGARFITAGSPGLAASSADGLNWIAEPFPTDQTACRLHWNSAQIVAIGTGGSLLTSVDGTHWVARASGTAAALCGIAWNGEQYVVVGKGGVVLTSADGATWSTHSAGTADDLTGAAWGAGLFAVTTSHGAILTSADGIVWTQRFAGTGAAMLYDIAWNGKLFQAAGSLLASSANGLDWNATERKINGINGYLYRLAPVGNGFIGLCGFCGLEVSPDGKTWMKVPDAPGVIDSGYPNSVVAAADRAVVAGPGLSAAMQYFNASCGTADGMTQKSLPQTWCAQGNVTKFAGAGPWSWVCNAALPWNSKVCRLYAQTPSSTTVFEYLNTADFPGAPGGHYFYSTDQQELIALDQGKAGHFARTGLTFGAAGQQPVCRFYGSINPGPNSHFFTADAGECAHLRALQLTPVPNYYQQWNYEGLGFGITPLIPSSNGGYCPYPAPPVYRAYNGAYTATNEWNGYDSNHRYVTDEYEYLRMTSELGWRGEGTVFCASTPQ